MSVTTLKSRSQPPIIIIFLLPTSSFLCAIIYPICIRIPQQQQLPHHSPSALLPVYITFHEMTTGLEFIAQFNYSFLVYIILTTRNFTTISLSCSVHVTWNSQLHRTIGYPAMPTGVVSAIFFIFVLVLFPRHLTIFTTHLHFFCLLITLFLRLFPHLAFQVNRRNT